MKYKAQECRCWCEYPNEAHKKRNGEWKCIDQYKCIMQGDWKHKTRCVLKEGDKMTKEEAIKRIRDFMGWFKKNKPLYEALEMAIHALEKENIYDDKEHYVTISKALYDKLNIDYEKALSQEPCESFEWGIDGNVYKITKAKDGKEICQQVCDDAISREAVLSKIKEVCFSKEWTQFRVDKGSNGQRDFIIDYIKQLPSATQKSGNWITKPHVYGVAYCSECDFELKIDDTNYCPNCGAKMVEPQESEE